MKVKEMRDNNIFKDLAGFLAPALDLPTAASLTKSLVQVDPFPLTPLPDCSLQITFQPCITNLQFAFWEGS